MTRRGKRNGGETHLEALVRDGVQSALVARLRVAAEQEGEALAREVLQDPEFRAEFLALARRVARKALEVLEAREAHD